MAICYSCFNEYGDEFDVCPFCGTIKHTDPSEPVYLKPGTMLANRYLVGYDVNAGGFGIVYRAWDTKLETIVAIKEVHPLCHSDQRDIGDEPLLFTG